MLSVKVQQLNIVAGLPVEKLFTDRAKKKNTSNKPIIHSLVLRPESETCRPGDYDFRILFYSLGRGVVGAVLCT